MPETKRPLKVFLCHARADKPKVRELYRYLRKRGIRPWFDEVDLVGGQDWQVEIPKALATSDAIIICLTKNSIDKEGYIQKEIKFALDKALEMPEGRIFLIPVRFEECDVPFSLSRYQWVDLFDEAGYARMMRALKFRASQLERATIELPKKDIEEEKLALEKAAHEKQEREAAEKAAREKAEREKAARQKLEREAAEKARKEEAERKAAEKAAREKAKRETAEKAKREREERRATQMAMLREAFSKSFNSFKLSITKAKPFLRFGGIIGIIFVILWVGSLAMPQLLSFVPTTKASVTSRPSATISLSNSPIPFTNIVEPDATLTQTRTPSATPTKTQRPTATFQLRTINWEGTQIPWPVQPISVDNAKDLKEIANIPIDGFDIVFSHDGKLVIYASGAVVYIRNTDDNTVRGLYHPHDVNCFSLSPDRNLLASVNGGQGFPGGRELRIWKINDGVLLQKFQAPYTYSYISCPVAFSPDGSSLALAENQGITFRRSSDLTLVQTITDPNNPTDSFNLLGPIFSPDGTLLAGINRSGTIYLWSTKDWTLKATIQDAGSYFYPVVVFSPNGNLLASLKDGMVLMWRVSDGTLIQTLKDTSSSNWLLDEPMFFLPNGQILVTGLGHAGFSLRREGFRLWRVADGKPIQDVEWNEYVFGGTISSDGTTLLISTIRDLRTYSQFIHLFGVKP